jgi:hypothetical protein
MRKEEVNVGKRERRKLMGVLGTLRGLKTRAEEVKGEAAE